MEDKQFDRNKVIKEMRGLKNKRIEEIKTLSKENGTLSTKIEGKVEIKYLGKMEFVNEQGEVIEKDVFISIEEVNGQFQFRYYDEEQNLLGIQIGIDENIILAANMIDKSLEEQKRISRDLERKDKEEAKTLEELEEEQKQEVQYKKEEQVADELAENTGNPELEIITYRKIVDTVFPQEYPQTCDGAKEIGMACLKDGTFMLVADYGNGFEMAKGTEPARATTEQVYDIDRQQQTIEKESPQAIMRVPGAGTNGNDKAISVTFDNGGELKIQSIDIAPDNTMVGRDIRIQGDDISKEKTFAEQQLETEQGLESVTNIADLVSGQSNEDNEAMKQKIVDSILQSHQEELESLYGEKTEQTVAIRRYIEDAVRNRGIIIPEEIQRFAEDNIESDYGRFFREHTQH